MTHNNNGDPIIVPASAIRVVDNEDTTEAVRHRSCSSSAHGSSGSNHNNNSHQDAADDDDDPPEVTILLPSTHRGGGGDVHQLALDLEQLQNHVLGLQGQLRHLRRKVQGYEQAAFTLFTLILGLAMGIGLQLVYHQMMVLQLSSGGSGGNLAEVIGAVLREAYQTPLSSSSPPSLSLNQRQRRHHHRLRYVTQFSTGPDSRYTGPMLQSVDKDWNPHGGFGAQDFPHARQEGVWHHGQLHGYARVVTWNEQPQVATSSSSSSSSSDDAQKTATTTIHNQTTPIPRHSTTTTTTLAATIYQGQFRHHELHGYGSITYPDGSHFDGHFAHYRRHGYGTLYNATEQRRVQGWWRHNRLVQTVLLQHEAPSPTAAQEEESDDDENSEQISPPQEQEQQQEQHGDEL